jgi:hypothetical protein
MKLILLVIALAALLVACSRGGSDAAPPRGVATASVADPFCGMRSTDWCASPPGDPCGDHKDQASCRADARCKGQVYGGESAVACIVDDRGFASNCPTVGCLSR